MNTYKLILIFLTLAFTSCSAHHEEQTFEESSLTQAQEISINVSQATTRTAIDSEDMTSTKWLSSDCIYLWAKESSTSTYVFTQAEFKQKYFYETYSHAVFTASVEAMSSGDYTYFGVYPKPVESSGSQVTYSLLSEQSGLYDGEMDIMVASPTEGGALSDSPDGDLALSFSHLTHALRINIPNGRNLFDQGVKKLEVTFPGDVVGDFSFDASQNTVSTSLSNTSKVVTLNLEEELDAGDRYVWIFIAPTTLSGDLSFRAYDSDGYKSEEISVEINKTMEAGRITPITLTVPNAVPVTTLNLSIKNNNLGEEIENMTITAPSGAQFIGGLSSITLPYNSENLYSIEYYDSEYGDKFTAGSLAITYESNSAIVSNSVGLSGVVANTTNTLTCDVPYLFEEDFSGVSSTDSYDGLDDTDYFGANNDVPGVDYWCNGRIFEYWKSTSIAIRTYYIWGVANGYINLDLDGITGLKSTATNITLTISFYADWVQNKCSSMKLKVYNDSSSSSTASISLSNVSKAAYNNVINERSVDLTYCNPTSIITWETNGSSSSLTWGYDYIYIDDVKISIK